MSVSSASCSPRSRPGVVQRRRVWGFSPCIPCAGGLITVAQKRALLSEARYPTGSDEFQVASESDKPRRARIRQLVILQSSLVTESSDPSLPRMTGSLTLLSVSCHTPNDNNISHPFLASRRKSLPPLQFSHPVRALRDEATNRS